ncbi:MAG: YncE family protein, partial [Nitrospira sp.]
MQRSSFFFLFVLIGSVSTMFGCAEVEVPKGPVDIPSRIYTANESSNDVSVIDAGTFAPVGTIDAKNQSTHDIAVSRDGRRIYATNLASGRLSVMDAGTMETIASIYTGQRCHVVALTNDN